MFYLFIYILNALDESLRKCETFPLVLEIDKSNLLFIVNILIRNDVFNIEKMLFFFQSGIHCDYVIRNNNALIALI